MQMQPSINPRRNNCYWESRRGASSPAPAPPFQPGPAGRIGGWSGEPASRF